VKQRTFYSQKLFETLGEGKGHELGAGLGAHQLIDRTLASGGYLCIIDVKVQLGSKIYHILHEN